MNDFILKLAKNNLVHERFSRYGESTEEDFYDFDPDELREFVAEIVRECAKVCYRTGMLEQEESTGRMYGDAVKEHFGVD